MRLKKQFCVFTLFIIFGVGCSALEKTYQKTQNVVGSLIPIDKENYSPILTFGSNIDIEFARHQFNRSEYAVSEFYIKKTLANRPDNREAIQLLPWAYFFQKRFDKALVAFKQAHARYKKDPTPLLGMGWCFFSLKDYQKALESFERAERFAPHSYEVHKGKAFSYLKQSQSQLAKEEFGKIFQPAKVIELLETWETWNQSTHPWEIVPSSPESRSIFTLPVEFPRYRSLLMGMPSNNLESLNSAWKSFYQRKYAKAADIFEDLTQTNSPNLDAVNGLAWSLLHLKQINKSEKVFKEILEIYPHFLGAFRGLEEIEEIKKHQAIYVQYYMDLGKHQLAVTKLDELLDQYSDWAHLYNQYGKVFLARNEYEKARDYFMDALEYSPHNNTAQLGLENVQKALDKQLYKADQALKKGDYKTATLIYHDYLGDEEWETTQFKVAHAYNGLGWSQFQKKQYEYAIDKFSKSIEHEDYEASSAKGLGLSLYAIKNYQDAIPYLETALKADPKNKNLEYKLDWSILRSEPLDSSKSYFEKILVDQPLSASPYMALGWIHYGMNNPDLAVEYFLKAISLDPDFALTQEFMDLLKKERFGWQVYNSLGWTYYQKQMYDKAMNMFKISLRIQPNKSEARKGMGYVYFVKEKYDFAITMLEQCLALNPDPNPVFERVAGPNAIAPFQMQTTARTKLGRTHYINGDISMAINQFNEEIRLNPIQPDAFDGLGWAYLNQGRILEARSAFNKAIELEPLNNSAHKGLNEAKLVMTEKRLKTKIASPFFSLKTSPN
ncbi:MAG: tetratricopeptide repeat protein [Nitrospina sp.]|nr:tetratricopeptide repeat protein [Nitrospina sp.]MBT3510432.1 tetratricopeptide repeat protein [Nitrospina sp.]MBT3875807.1 tetratricopeptide repeat protein [Nitrospina sp.]MBT4049254.1 tetratricopeptide repeat protein [Nitrospina sp.]